MNNGCFAYFQSSASCWDLLDWAYSPGLVPLGRVVCILQNQQHMLPWAFLPHGLLLVNILWVFIDTCNGSFGQLIVLFETIGQASKCSCKFHIVNNAHDF